MSGIGRCVLVVDDEPTSGDRPPHLARAGCTTRVARDETAALAAAKEQRPDLVALDLMLPGIDGLEIGETVRGVGPLAASLAAAVALSALTAQPSAGRREPASARSCSHFASAPSSQAVRRRLRRLAS